MRQIKIVNTQHLTPREAERVKQHKLCEQLKKKKVHFSILSFNYKNTVRI